MMDSIAAAAVGMQQAQLMQSYSIAVSKSAMETQEQMATDLLNMLPQTPAIQKGQYIDVYA